MSLTPEQERADKAVKIGLVAPIPILAVVIFFAASDSGSHHSVIRGAVVCAVYLAVIVPTSVYILRKRRTIAMNGRRSRSVPRRDRTPRLVRVRSPQR